MANSATVVVAADRGEDFKTGIQHLIIIPQLLFLL